MECPQCKLAMERTNRFWVCPSCGQTRRVDGSVDSSVDSLLLSQLPGVVALPLMQYFTETHPVMLLHRLCDAAEVLTRFLTMVGWLDRAEVPERLTIELKTVFRSSIERPSFGQWAGMLRSLAQAEEKEPGGLLIPEIPAFACRTWLPALGGNEDDVSYRIIALRNLLSHSGNITHTQARELAATHKPGFLALIQSAVFLKDLTIVQVGKTGLAALRGVESELQPVEAPCGLEEWLKKQQEGHVVLLRSEKGLRLWPLFDYEQAEIRSQSSGRSRKASQPSPWIYLRSEDRHLMYTALCGDIPFSQRSQPLEEFKAIFRLNERRVEAKAAFVEDFRDEIARDARALCGRRPELKRIKEAVKGAQTGILWLSGTGGIGKTMLMAVLADDQSNTPRKKQLVVAYRFRAGDPRCSTMSFLRLTVREVSAWLVERGILEKEETPEDRLQKLELQLGDLLRMAKKLRAENERDRIPRILLVVDGWDEILRYDATLVELPFRHQGENVVWVCAGRPEGNLPGVFSADRCTQIFPDGLPGMSAEDVRTMLIENTGEHKYKLLDRDVEHGHAVINPFVEAVVARASGLPLYVHFVVEDIKQLDLTYRDESRLPQGLQKYYDELLQRLSIGDLQALLTPLVMLIAWAEGPLSEDALVELMTQSCELRPGNAGRELLSKGLNYIQGLFKVTSTMEGRPGFVPYHDTFRDYLRTCKATQHSGLKARKAFADAAVRWRTFSGDGDARRYLLRHGAVHLVDQQRWDQVVDLLCDLDFIEAKSTAGMVYSLAADFPLVEEHLPEAQSRLECERQLNEKVGRWTEAIIDYARKWSDARDRNAQDPQKSPLPDIKDITVPRPLESIDQWEPERTGAVIARISKIPHRSDRLSVFRTFVGNHLAVLATGTVSVFQVAYNSAASGPVMQLGERYLVERKVKQPWIRLVNRPQYNPKPACLRTLEEHSGFVNSVALTADGRNAISGSEDNTLRVWDVETGNCLRSLKGHTLPVRSVSLTLDGRRAVSGSVDMTLRVWDVETGTCLRTLQGHTEAVMSVALTADGRRAISGSDDNTLRVWDVETGTCLRSLGMRMNAVSSVALAADGRRAIWGSEDNTLRVWDVETGTCLRTLQGHTLPIWSVALTLDGRRAVSGSADMTLRVWDMETGACLRILGHEDAVSSVALTADGRRAISGSMHNTLRVWDVETGACLRTLESCSDAVSSVALMSDGRRAVLGIGNALRVWDVETGACPWTSKGHTASVSAVAMMSDGRRAVSGGYDNTLRVWDLETGACLRALEGQKDWGWMCSVALTADDRRAVSGGGDNTLRVWDIANGVCLRALEGHRKEVSSVALTADGHRAVSGSHDNTLRVWDVETGICLRTLEGHREPVSSVALTADGRRAVSGSHDNTLQVWDVETGVCLRTLEGHKKPVSSVALTADGRRAVTGSDNTLRVWDVETGVCLATSFSSGGTYTSLVMSHVGAVAGKSSGYIEVLHWMNMPDMGIPFLIPVRLWIFGENGTPGRWDDRLSVQCCWCRCRFALEEPLPLGQKISCPRDSCDKQLRLTPFVCDNR